MLKWFKRNSNGNGTAKSSVQFADLDGIPLAAGDTVECLRYDLGICKIHQTENGYEYESVSSGDRVSYLRMIDAATSFQKVRKLDA
ncbi:hypothetical protein [Pontibacter sp. G13]|uniref:hypothetical protein n=1 Tax=Pontibacter sp. G13 TaxID=3074898 RepID=UPI00288B8452|nr:hypothetical protein [Pontibacter sp. G13]WNJ19398.1 hypothetical protein RJD25_02805 [Pontibacter sp. G13]